MNQASNIDFFLVSMYIANNGGEKEIQNKKELYRL